MKKFYLSPSSQANNAYIVGGTTEKIQMEDLCKQIRDKMNAQYDVECAI